MALGTYLIITLVTLITLTLGIAIGYLFGTKKVEEIKEKLFTEQKPLQSGSIKPMMVREKQEEKEHRTVNKSLEWLK
ncbi:MAG: hypothetical protein A2Z42_02970 [Candidatus Woykebacteria bacterium RBG_19FT_COMBO_43_10]|uniref:Uncharacterized protein n=1 Tax=Candidatus Woykebacteria bacterium RBG_19FT_COMBO_43_10 TaxID=1802598 RepID=A0A1G1WK70_9BACT|nr:MAG: hypothetical protein A2Z42_02970 [Candidatus Woykebacteria bacterium RBG_19FT_COMBO_43_10]